MTNHDLRDIFKEFGKLESIEMKRGGYAFVEFGKFYLYLNKAIYILYIYIYFILYLYFFYK